MPNAERKYRGPVFHSALGIRHSAFIGPVADNHGRFGDTRPGVQLALPPWRGDVNGEWFSQPSVLNAGRFFGLPAI
jgi:hypothetical protein